MRIRVAIVEDNKDILQALEQIVGMTDECELCCSCISGEEALQRLPACHADVVLMDIHLGGINGIEVVRELKPQLPKTQFMMCTIYEEDEKIFEALSAGASGYITKKTAPGQMIEAIKELHHGGAPMSSQIARKVVSAFSVKPSSASEETLERLSRREAEILEMLSKGLVYKEIADELSISSETVRKHVYNIYNKLHVSNRVEAVNKYFGR
ncbi:MAG: response regulator transcription factor [Ferruginibacter sp.]|jgi:DNA-binding NarL/FixJ family response regulator